MPTPGAARKSAENDVRSRQPLDRSIVWGCFIAAVNRAATARNEMLRELEVGDYGAYDLFLRLTEEASA